MSNVPKPSDTKPLTFADLRAANVSRADKWNAGADAGILFRAVELGEEAGEVLGAVKKIHRLQQGMKGGKDMSANLIEELGDVVICADLLAQPLGIDLGQAVAAKFNATSEKHGFSERLPLRLVVPASDDQAKRIDQLVDDLVKLCEKYHYQQDYGSNHARKDIRFIIEKALPSAPPAAPEPAQIIATTARREWLCRNMPKCAKCGESHQIQLVEWLTGDARWKCRACNHAWTFEPAPPVNAEPLTLIRRIVDEPLDIINGESPDQQRRNQLEDIRAILNSVSVVAQTPSAEPVAWMVKALDGSRLFFDSRVAAEALHSWYSDTPIIPVYASPAPAEIAGEGAMAELVKLRAIVEKLPRTKDGVPIARGTKLYSDRHSEIAICTGAFARWESGGGWCDTSYLESRYSTREAAEAARAESMKGGTK